VDEDVDVDVDVDVDADVDEDVDVWMWIGGSVAEEGGKRNARMDFAHYRAFGKTLPWRARSQEAPLCAALRTSVASLLPSLDASSLSRLSRYAPRSFVALYCSYCSCCLRSTRLPSLVLLNSCSLGSRTRLLFFASLHLVQIASLKMQC